MKIFLAFILFSPISFAALTSPYIFERTTESNGLGSYQIEQEVSLTVAAETLLTKEVWLVESNGNSFVSVYLKKDGKDILAAQILYRGTQKFSSLNKSAESISAEFIEPLFFARVKNKPGFTDILARLGVPKEPMRLGRTAGVVNWVFGIASDPDSSTLQPGLWIEQDQFVIRKLRLPKGPELSVEDYTTGPHNIRFPQTRYLRWGSNSAQIKTSRIVALSSLKLNQPKFNDGNLSPAAQEFYSRFR